jgi:predicted metal-dependent phosphoesterase TrpH
MKFDLHTHTDHTFDCLMTVESLVKAAEQNDLDAIAVTDLDTMSACSLADELSDKVSIIPGMEIATSRGTHIIGLFLNDEIVSRNIFDVIDEIHEQSGLVMLPHPYRERIGLFHNRYYDELYDGEEMTRIMSGVDLIEAFAYGSTSDEAVETDNYLQSMPDISQVTGSDAHCESDLGKACMELDDCGSGSLEDIKKALLKSSRTLRYEAYTAEDETETKTLVIKGRRRSLFWKFRKPLIQPVWHSIKSVYDRSAQFLKGSKVKNTLRD